MMNTRVKAVVAGSVGALLLLLLVAHWTARIVADSDYQGISTLLSEQARQFSGNLPSYYTRIESTEQLHSAVASLGSARLTSILLDKTTRVIASGPANNLATELATYIHNPDGVSGGGHISHKNQRYVWGSAALSGSPYHLVLLYRLDTSDAWYPAWLVDSRFLPLAVVLVFAAGWLGYRSGIYIEWATALGNTVKSQALADPLTGLPNRALFIDRLRQQIHLGRRSGQTLAVCHLNLDRFSSINEFLGSVGGDQLLALVGQRILKSLRTSDTVARLNADQFLILLNAIDESQILHVAQKVLRNLEESFQIGEHNLFVRGNIGIAIYPHHGEDEQVLRTHAESAMKVAKKAGTDVIVYNKKHDEYTIRHLALVNDLHQAITQNGFELYFQPKIDVRQREIVSVEVLLRWNHPRLGAVSPEQFIPVAEQTGLIQPLTQLVINGALKACAQLHQRGFPLTVAVNVSMYNLIDSSFERKISEHLAEHDVASRYLELEITESAMMSNPVRSKELLQVLAMRGLRFSIDDFGTGYSSLTYLKQIPLDELKIDKSFVLQMLREKNETAIAKTILGLGKDLGLRVVAEGVESQEVLDRLRQLGCTVFQGFHLCRPLAFEEFAAWLETVRETYRVLDETPLRTTGTSVT